jgi:hypothetical protein
MTEGSAPVAKPERSLLDDLYRQSAITDLALVVPIFVVYHVGVVLLKVRNAADLVTQQLTALAEHHIALYWLITFGIGAAIAAVLFMLGRGEAFDKKRFVLVALEATLYAVLMRMAAIWAVGSMPLTAGADPALAMGVGEGIVMSLGAGLYEEIVFRVGLFGVGTLGIKLFFGGIPKWFLMAGWALITACIFSGWHYVGAMGDPWNARTFVFRAACGVVLTAVYVFRGFAPAVWTHALYDVWALVLND